MNYRKLILISIVIVSIVAISFYYVISNEGHLLTAKDALETAEQLTEDIDEDLQLISIVSDNCTIDGVSDVWTITYFSSEPVIVNNISILNKYTYRIYANGTHEFYQGNDYFIFQQTTITNLLIDSNEASTISQTNITVMNELDNIHELNHVQIYSQDNVTLILLQYSLIEPSNGNSGLVCKLNASTGDILSVYYR